MQGPRDDFLRHLEKLGRSPKTIEAYGQASRRLEALGSHQGWTLAALPRSALTALAEHLAGDEGLAASTVHLYVTGAAQYLRWCRDQGYAVPEMARPALPRIREALPVVLKEKALAAYVQVAQTVADPYKTALLLLPASGLRVSELCRLELDDVDVSPPWVRFRIRSGKSKRDRLVPLLRAAKPILWRYLDDVRPHLTGDRWLFPNAYGRPIAKRMVQKHMRRVRARIGIPDLTPHKLRHTYLTILNENGITGFDLAEIAGHRNLSTTRLYVHPQINELSRRVEQIQTDWMNHR